MIYGVGYHLQATSVSELFSITRYKEALVADHMQLCNRNLMLNISFTIPVYDWELDLATLFFDLL